VGAVTLDLYGTGKDAPGPPEPPDPAPVGLTPIVVNDNICRTPK
jgi:hypothetical protein